MATREAEWSGNGRFQAIETESEVGVCFNISGLNLYVFLYIISCVCWPAIFFCHVIFTCSSFSVLPLIVLTCELLPCTCCFCLVFLLRRHSCFFSPAWSLVSCLYLHPGFESPILVRFLNESLAVVLAVDHLRIVALHSLFKKKKTFYKSHSGKIWTNMVFSISISNPLTKAWSIK